MQTDVLLRMQEELAQALQHTEPVQWAMVIDVKKCLGCHACTVTCMAENALPQGMKIRPVFEKEQGCYPFVSRNFTPRSCMQCTKPPCITVCPSQATWQEEKYGITLMDSAKCIGCTRCIKACPYAARHLDVGQHYLATAPSLPSVLLGKEGAQCAYAKVFSAKHAVANENTQSKKQKKRNTVYKCHFCLPRLQRGQLPACVTACIGRATIFGNSNNAHTLVSHYMASPRTKPLHQELGTSPQVFYYS